MAINPTPTSSSPNYSETPFISVPYYQPTSITSNTLLPMNNYSVFEMRKMAYELAIAQYGHLASEMYKGQMEELAENIYQWLIKA